MNAEVVFLQYITLKMPEDKNWDSISNASCSHIYEFSYREIKEVFLSLFRSTPGIWEIKSSQL